MKKINVPFVRSAYNYDAEAASQESGLLCEDESLAQQHQKEEADINTIVRRFGLTGQLPELQRLPQYGDFTHVTDYHSAVNAVMAANGAFSQLPADLRSRFNNDPEQFVDFCSNPDNMDELIKMGLAKKRAEEEEPAEPAPTKPQPREPRKAAKKDQKTLAAGEAEEE